MNEYLDLEDLERAEEISKRLEAKGFASTNIVFGIGSFSYQYHTRDTFGFAVKATSATVNGEERLLFKDPKTDDGTKRSQRGRVVVAKATDVSDLEVYQLTDNQTGNRLVWKDGLNEAQEHELQKDAWNALEPVFLDGKLLVDQDLATIRERLIYEGGTEGELVAKAKEIRQEIYEELKDTLPKIDWYEVK